jgi:tetratricopeptide (TPR) repeat protein
MSLSLGPVVRTLGLTMACAGALGAQAAQQKACEVNEGRPTQVGRALLAVQVATSAQDPAAAARQLSAAVKGLTENGEKMDNQVGRNFVLGKALVLWSTQPNVELVTKRGPLGYTTNPEGTIDLAAAIDSSFKVVEAAHPECINETARWRGQKAWVNLVNKAIERLNADDPDSAEAVSKAAILMNPYGPYGYVVLGNVLQKRGKASEAFVMYRKSVDMAKRDTSYDDIRRQSLVYLGNLAADSAELITDAAARRPYVETARSAFEQLMADPEAGDIKESARAGMCRVAIASGDTAALRTNYKAQLDAPAGFTYATLMNAGVCMARAEMVPEASQLFRAAYEKNPYHRDALSNLSIMLLQSDRHAEALPLAQRLVEVEPNNPENLQLLVLANAGLAKGVREQRMGPSKAAPATKTKAGTTTKTATKTAPAAPRLSQAVQDSLFKLEQRYTEAAVSANERREKLPFKVSLSDFTANDTKASVAGTVTNQGTAGKTVTVRVEFLDATGKVVASKEQALGEIAPSRSSRFSIVHTPGKEIAAFRYAPLP